VAAEGETVGRVSCQGINGKRGRQIEKWDVNSSASLLITSPGPVEINTQLVLD
jgi:hypothetical protein